MTYNSEENGPDGTDGAVSTRQKVTSQYNDSVDRTIRARDKTGKNGRKRRWQEMITGN